MSRAAQQVLRVLKARGKPFSEAMRALAFAGHVCSEYLAVTLWRQLPMVSTYVKVRKPF
jgi:hypothetical protein